MSDLCRYAIPMLGAALRGKRFMIVVTVLIVSVALVSVLPYVGSTRSETLRNLPKAEWVDCPGNYELRPPRGYAGTPRRAQLTRWWFTASLYKWSKPGVVQFSDEFATREYPRNTNHYIGQLASGWPLRTHWWHLEARSVEAIPDANALDAHIRLAPLLVNSICVSCAIFVAALGGVVVRGIVRMRAGRCPICAYPLLDAPHRATGVVCPECGLARSVRGAHAPALPESKH